MASASHVVVIDSTARRHTVKTTPTKYLSDVLQEACAKFGLDSDQYGLKHNNKAVDLSRTLRLSGLSSGAKLNLVQLSKSPSLISVALQLPASDESPNGTARLTGKFPSNTPLWQILRRFESGVAGGDTTRQQIFNFTQRSAAIVANGGPTGSGRLCYAMPVINVIGRDLSTIEELQRTLGQLGVVSGSAMMRLGFRSTDQPLEEAMAKISKYFQAIDNITPKPDAVGAPDVHQLTDRNENIPPTATEAFINNDAYEAASELPNLRESEADGSQANTTYDQPPSTTANTSAVPIQIFAPPTGSTPAAATVSSNSDADYVPTIDHAKRHQDFLNKQSRNRKLLSDAELATQAQQRSERLTLVNAVTVRFRFPDQSQAQRDFARHATATELYATCRELMDRPAGEEFTIRITGEKGGAVTVDDNSKALIGDLGWQNRTLVLVVWADGVSAESKRRPCLKPEYRNRAEELKVDVSTHEPSEDDKVAASSATDGHDLPKEKGASSMADREAKLKRFLGKLSKK
ncbi:MAG: hypothetical protein M1828_005475 [Chrysothrix sp. TS-e1954]|nr:MAG: hypothetical protein M1828_005475 [Chrysothrix sp. TS-e1954]